jgi:hypothetical protein
MSPLAPRSDRLQALVEYAQQQGLQPGDFAHESGRDAFVAIAQAIAPRTAIDTETHKPKTLIVDSLSPFCEHKTTTELRLLALYGSKRRSRPVKPLPSALTDAWHRVLQHALGRPR